MALAEIYPYANVSSSTIFILTSKIGKLVAFAICCGIEIILNNTTISYRSVKSTIVFGYSQNAKTFSYKHPLLLWKQSKVENVNKVKYSFYRTAFQIYYHLNFNELYFISGFTFGYYPKGAYGENIIILKTLESWNSLNLTVLFWCTEWSHN